MKKFLNAAKVAKFGNSCLKDWKLLESCRASCGQGYSPFSLGMDPSRTLILKLLATDSKLILKCTWVIFTPAGILHRVFSPIFVPSLVNLTDPALSLNCISYVTKQGPASTFFHFTLTQPGEGFPACGAGRISRFAVMNCHLLSLLYSWIWT